MEVLGVCQDCVSCAAVIKTFRCYRCVSNFVLVLMFYILLAQKHMHGKYAREETYLVVLFAVLFCSGVFFPDPSQLQLACFLKQAASNTDIKLLVGSTLK